MAKKKLGNTRPSYPPEFRRRMTELVRSGRTPEALSREFEPTAQSIRNWVSQAERDLDQLAVKLESADELVGYNSVWYDHVVLDQALGRRIYLPNETDLYLAIRQTRANRDPNGTWKLGEVCKRTIGRGKTMEGAGAPHLIEAGDWGKLVTYCTNDVKLLRDLHRFVLNFGYVIGPEGEKVSIAERKDQ